MTTLAAIQFDSHYFWQHLLHPQAFFLRAIWTTVYVAVLGQTLGTLLGLPIAMARRSPNRLLVSFAWFYSWLWRGTPVTPHDVHPPAARRWQSLNKSFR